MSYDDNHRGVDRRRGSGSQTQNQDTGMASDLLPHHGGAVDQRHQENRRIQIIENS